MTTPTKKDKELVAAARKFAEQFAVSAKSSKSMSDFDPDNGTTIGSAGAVEITQEMRDARMALRNRAIQLLGTKAGHEKTIDSIIIKQSHRNVSNGIEVDTAAEAIIGAILEEALTVYDYVVSNYIFRLHKNADDIRIGHVRIMRTSSAQAENKSSNPELKLILAPTGKQGFEHLADETIVINLEGICWKVTVDATSENVEEETKWLIDVAISLIRLSYQGWPGFFPSPGDIEPYPTRPAIMDLSGIKFQAGSTSFGGSKTPNWYEVDDSIMNMCKTDEFQKKANLLMTPPKDSLASRVSQGLGWHTRGRQSADRAERLLYFFTAIEALLSGTDKSAPVVQTICRHSAIILTNNNEKRSKFASRIKKLYELRSAIVHGGQRDVHWSAAIEAQNFAEALYFIVMRDVDLSQKHSAFALALATCSYGLPWPPKSE